MPDPASPFALSARLVDEAVSHDPMLASYLGVKGRDDAWPALDPEWYEVEERQARRYVHDLSAHTDHPERQERLAARVLAAWLGEQVERFDAGDHLRDIAHLASPFQRIRLVFDMQAHGSDEEREALARRIETLERPLEGLRRTFRLGLERGLVQSARQVRAVIDQAEAMAEGESAWSRFTSEASSPSWRQRLEEALDRGRSALGGFAGWLREEYLPNAPEEDGVGRERYLRAADALVGMRIDPEEVYEWGWEEIGRLRSEMKAVATRIDPDASSLEGVVELLERDPARAAHTPQQLLAFVEEREEQALRDLSGVHFEVADEISRVTVNLAPSGGALGAHYVQPSEDFTRPGGIWYSLGDQDIFPLYQEVATAYHEGFPGHHLQIGTTMVQRERLSRAQRLLVWYSGYGEGWALYTERLMQELGYFEKPDYVFGLLASQLFRAARVVVDIGLHLGLRIPDDAPLHPGQDWRYEVGVDYMDQIGLQPRDYAESEVTRYLGWPGQAISYKVGEREILGLREEARRRQGGQFDLKEFHGRVLADGEMRFDLLREVVLDW